MREALSPAVAEACEEAGLDHNMVSAVVLRALEEDLRLGPDVTTEAIVAEEATASGAFVARAQGVLAGGPVVVAVFDLLGGFAQANPVLAEGSPLEPGDEALIASGSLRHLLLAERTALNLLCHLSGIATSTAAWVEEIAGTGAVVRDTRKTTPGLRELEKYAVRCGGGRNHRLALGDAALVKDNHVAAAGSVKAAFMAVRESAPTVAVEVECDELEQVKDAIEAGADLVLLDNMSLEEMTACVEVARSHPGVRLEASGGLSLDRARAVAETGVDFLAVGALTHSSPSLDIGFDLNPLSEAGGAGGAAPRATTARIFPSTP